MAGDVIISRGALLLPEYGGSLVTKLHRLPRCEQTVDGDYEAFMDRLFRRVKAEFRLQVCIWIRAHRCVGAAYSQLCQFINIACKLQLGAAEQTPQEFTWK